MIDENMLKSIRQRLDDMSIFGVRQVARAVGVPCATSGKKEEAMRAVLDIAAGAASPVTKRTKRGAPPKSNECDEKLVADVLACRMRALLPDDGSLTGVSDNGTEKYGEGIVGYADGVYVIYSRDEHINKAEIDNQLVSRYKLREGDAVLAMFVKDEKKGFNLCGIVSVNGTPAERHTKAGVKFGELTRLFPQRRIILADGVASNLTRFFAPFAYGQRAVIAAPPKSGKTYLLKDMATAVMHGGGKAELIVALLAEQPEIIEDFKKDLPDAKFFCTSFEKAPQETLTAAHLAVEYAKRRAENGANAVVILDGVNKLYRAYISAGKQAIAISEINALLCSAVNTAEGGSLTVLYTLSEKTGEEEIYSAFTDCANMTVTLSRSLASRRIFPAADILNCGADGEERLLTEEESKVAKNIRAELAGGGDEAEIIKFLTECGPEEIISRFSN